MAEFDKISALEDMSTDMTECWLRLKRYDKIREMYDSETGEMKTGSPCFVGKDV
jgi:hypothetical protein